MTYWIFSSNNLENIETGCKHLLWGFFDPDYISEDREKLKDKLKKNWRNFLGKYNQIKPFDIAVFQIAKTGEIHAIGVIKERYFDDQTPIWDIELKLKRVIFPWRVSFSAMIFSGEPVVKKFVKIQDYIDGYGLGVLEPHEFNFILKAFQEKFGNIFLG